MHSLPDIVKAIALNNKLNESRDLAESVQRSMVQRLARGASSCATSGSSRRRSWCSSAPAMPSVLAEISFITHKQEGALLKTGRLPAADRPGAARRRRSATSRA